MLAVIGEKGWNCTSTMVQLYENVKNLYYLVSNFLMENVLIAFKYGVLTMLFCFCLLPKMSVAVKYP